MAACASASARQHVLVRPYEQYMYTYSGEPPGGGALDCGEAADAAGTRLAGGARGCRVARVRAALRFGRRALSSINLLNAQLDLLLSSANSNLVDRHVV